MVKGKVKMYVVPCFGGFCTVQVNWQLHSAGVWEAEEYAVSARTHWITIRISGRPRNMDKEFSLLTQCCEMTTSDKCTCKQGVIQDSTWHLEALRLLCERNRRHLWPIREFFQDRRWHFQKQLDFLISIFVPCPASGFVKLHLNWYNTTEISKKF